ncbi:MAG: VWA domain-containing protein [Phycisphaeraceae bacterium]|nr:VWA domain-containing protein [Phycisphaeraceae bacterium]
MSLPPFHLGPIQFDQPIWLLIAIPMWALAIWIGRSSLSGMGTASRRVALVVRLLVILLLLGAVARPQWRQEADTVVVSVVLDQSKSVPLALQSRAKAYLEEAAAASAQKGDQQAAVTVAREAYVRALPTTPGAMSDTEQIGDRDGTNLAEGLRLAMAVMPKTAANTALIISDFNETAGDLMAAAQAARAAGLKINVLPLRYKNDREVELERLVAPATARMGETVNLRVLLSATRPTSGRLNVLIDGEPIKLDPDASFTGMDVSLIAGMNPLTIPVVMSRGGAVKFEAVFDPIPEADNKLGDTIAENNRGEAISFVSGQGRVLVLGSSTEEAAPLVKALNDARIQTELRDLDQAPRSLVELGAYDAVVLLNASAYRFSQQQQEDLRTYVHDLGGGMVMIGGPDSFGAGGWIGSPLADALPIKLDPPQKRQMPRGALVLMMHSCEMPNGNYWGKQTALAAVKNLSAQDLVGVVEYGWQSGGAEWVWELQEVGSRAGVNRAISNMNYGDAPSFDAFMRLAIPALEKANAGLKHAIIISDGDPQAPSPALIGRYRAAKVTVSTVLVFPHYMGASGPDFSTMRDIAEQTGGNYYQITEDNQLKSLPEIFIKEAQTVRRALIWEGKPFNPSAANVATDAMRGIPLPVPPITGYIVTAEREGLSQVSLRGVENDPILASWQYGLGKSVAFTSDATNRWCAAWLRWPSYRAFWEQHVRWAMRPNASADVRVATEDRGDSTRIVIEALDPGSGERLNFLRFRGRVVDPDGGAESVELRQTGPGRYEGQFKSDRSGSYVLSYRYDIPAAEGTPAREGTVQAAVTRPFADEFRALEDNSALAQQIATLTGGRVLSGDPKADDLWTRNGLVMPVSLTSIWLWFAAIAIGTFLVDVAVRRVRIDLPAMALAIKRGLSARREKKAGQQLASLHEARQRAQQSIAQRSAEQASGGSPRADEPAAPMDPSVRTAKFEASADELAAARKSGPAGAMGTQAPDTRPAPGQPQKPKDKAAEEEGINRLLKAKKRAQDQMEQD